MDNFNPLKCFYDRNYPIVFSKFQLKEIDSSLSLPYDSITQSLRFLYGVDSIIVFRLDLYGKD